MSVYGGTFNVYNHRITFEKKFALPILQSENKGKKSLHAERNIEAYKQQIDTTISLVQNLLI